MLQEEGVVPSRAQRLLPDSEGLSDLRLPDEGQRLLAGFAQARAVDAAALIEEAGRLCRRALPISSFAVMEPGAPGIMPADAASLGAQGIVRLLVPGDCLPLGVLHVGSADGQALAAADLGFLAAVAELLGAGLARLGQGGAAHRAGADGTQSRLRDDLQVLQGFADIRARSAPASGRAGHGQRLVPLAALYDHLPGAGPGTRVDLGEYLRSLCARIEAAGDLVGRGVALATELCGASASLEAAASLGAVVNELVTTAAERAPKGGRILVRLAADDDGRATLLVAGGDEAGWPSRAVDHDALRYVRRLVERAGARIEQAGSASWRIDLT